MISLACFLRYLHQVPMKSRCGTGHLLIPLAPRRGGEALNRVKDARPAAPVGIVPEMAQVGEERIPLCLSRSSILEQARHCPMKRGQRANQQNGMQRRAVRSVGRGATTTLQGSVSMSPRSLLARDIRNLRLNTDAPNSVLQQLIELNKTMYPEAFAR